MTSFWQQTAPPIETDPFPVGSDVDVVIVGAGSPPDSAGASAKA